MWSYLMPTDYQAMAYERVAPADHSVVDAVATHLHQNENSVAHRHSRGPCSDCWLRAGRAVAVAMEHARARDAGRTSGMTASVTRLHRVIEAVTTQAEEWAKLAPPNDWGESVHDAVLSDVGRKIQRIIKDAFKEVPSEDQ